MKSIFPSQIKWGRFFFLVLLFANFHIIYAVCKSEEAYPEISSSSESIILFVSKETTVSGLEYLHISRPDVKKKERQFTTVKKAKIVKKVLKKTKRKVSKISQKPKIYYTFRNATKSNTFEDNSCSKIVYTFGSGSFNFKSFVKDDLKTIPILIVLLGIFLINFYKSRILFNYYFSKNFQRPPPVILSI